jgi:NAD(P)-dependent dehydrogenase (short-subunit alcohol dehydrogenase family)
MKPTNNGVVMQNNDDFTKLVHPKDIFNLKGKVILIMGGAGKMGQAFAEALSNAGATLYLLDLSDTYARQCAAEISEKSEGTVFGMGCDLGKQENITSRFKEIRDKEGRIDTLIYNVYAKPEGYYRKFEDYELETWEKVMAANITGAYLSCQEAVKCFKELSIPGNIILTLSTYGIVCPDLRIYEGLEGVTNIYGGKDPLTTPMAYVVSKNGLIGMIKYLAGTCGKDNIRVNGLSPGGVFDGQEESFYNAYTSRVPLGRMATWTEYNGAILFLTSDASRYMTGANLVVDGGWTTW